MCCFDRVSSERARWYVGLPAVATVVGAWSGAIPTVLDWNRPWQKWPITCTYGALLGYIAGVVVLFALEALVPKHHRVRTTGTKVGELIRKQRAEDELFERMYPQEHQRQQKQQEQKEQQQQQEHQKGKKSKAKKH